MTLQAAESGEKAAGTSSIGASVKRWLLTVLCIAVFCVWIGGIVHSFRHHGVGNRVFAILFPPWGVFRGVEGFFSNESGLLGFNLDSGLAKMRTRVQKELDNEEVLKKVLAKEPGSFEYIPADNSGVIGEQQKLVDEGADEPVPITIEQMGVKVYEPSSVDYRDTGGNGMLVPGWGAPLICWDGFCR